MDHRADHTSSHNCMVVHMQMNVNPEIGWQIFFDEIFLLGITNIDCRHVHVSEDRWKLYSDMVSFMIS